MSKIRRVLLCQPCYISLDNAISPRPAETNSSYMSNSVPNERESFVGMIPYDVRAVNDTASKLKKKPILNTNNFAFIKPRFPTIGVPFVFQLFKTLQV